MKEKNGAAFVKEEMTEYLVDLEMLVRKIRFAENVNPMETNNKEQYVTPAATVVDVKSEGHICLSDGVRATRNGYGDAIEEDWR